MTDVLDPIKFEVIRNALLMATEEMATTLRRSAYSTNVKTRQDFSCAFFDRELRPVAQAFSQPVHLGSFVELIPRAVATYGADRIDPGDMIMVNDPYGGGVHLNPNPPKDTDGRREGSGRGWVRELQGRWPGLLG